MNNFLVSLVFGVPAAVMLWWYHNPAVFVAAFIWALWVEYVMHRWLQHNPGTIFADRHHAHHASYKRWDEEEHLSFGGSPIYTAVLFVANSLPLLLHPSWLPPALFVFVVYFDLMEVVHRRIHKNLWLPFNIGSAHHHRHHRQPPKNFNVFIPLFDIIFGTKD